MVGIVVVIFGVVAWGYDAVQDRRADLRERVAQGEFEIRKDAPATTTDQSAWQTIYPNTVGIIIGSVAVQASVADTLSSRIKGLSNTPYLPDTVVKLFAFGVAGEHSIWMKDMNYAIDIIWADQEGKIVHIEENVTPDTFPNTFSSPSPAWFVVEANAGFVAQHGIAIGDKIVLPVGE